jgi:hypothetical protein
MRRTAHRTRLIATLGEAGVVAEPFLYSGTNFMRSIVMDVRYGVNDFGVVAGGVVWDGQLVRAIDVPMPAFGVAYS